MNISRLCMFINLVINFEGLLMSHESNQSFQVTWYQKDGKFRFGRGAFIWIHLCIQTQNNSIHLDGK